MKLLSLLLTLTLMSAATAEASQIQKWEYARFSYVSAGKASDRENSYEWIEPNRKVNYSWKGFDSYATYKFINKITGKDVYPENMNGFLNLFNLLGESGWELTSSEVNDYEFMKSTTYYFKRPVTK